MGKFKKNKGKGAKVVKTKYHGGSKAITKQRKNALLSWLHPFAQQNEPFLKRLQGNPSGILNAVRAVKPNDQADEDLIVLENEQNIVHIMELLSKPELLLMGRPNGRHRSKGTAAAAAAAEGAAGEDGSCAVGTAREKSIAETEQVADDSRAAMADAAAALGITLPPGFGEAKVTAKEARAPAAHESPAAAAAPSGTAKKTKTIKIRLKRRKGDCA